MQQEDWFIKQINQLARVLGKLLADLLVLKSQGRISEGMEAAEQTLKNELGLNIDNLISIPKDQFIETLQQGKKFGDDIFEILADIFFLIAEELHKNGKDIVKMKTLYERSLTIYKYLDKTGSTYSIDRHNKIGKINEVL